MTASAGALGPKTIGCAMVGASGTLRCFANWSFILSSTRCAALLLAQLSWAAVFSTTGAAQQPVGELDAMGVDVNREGLATHSKINLLSGSSIQADLQIATLNLKRGGKVLVCPRTKLTVSTSADGRGLVFQLDSGNLELDYPLAPVADSLITPKLRLMMSGPGALHQAVGVSSNGDTCVQSLPANRTWVVVSDARSDAVYQMQSDAAAEFKGGSISGVEPTRRNCGCPSSPPNDSATAPSPGAKPEQPKQQPQPIVAKEDRPPEAPSASRNDMSPSLSPAVARSVPVQHTDSGSSEREAPSGLATSATSLLPHVPSVHTEHTEHTKSPAARQMSGSFTVQVGSFRVKENADRLAERLKSKQYPVEVLELPDSSHQPWYVVRVGKYENRSLADSVAAKLASEENLGLKPIVNAL